MKRLIDSAKGEKVKVLKLDVAYDLKQRLISFGIMKDTVIQMLEYAPRKKTVEIKVGKMRIALREEEAELIEVGKI